MSDIRVSFRVVAAALAFVLVACGRNGSDVSGSAQNGGGGLDGTFIGGAGGNGSGGTGSIGGAGSGNRTGTGSAGSGGTGGLGPSGGGAYPPAGSGFSSSSGAAFSAFFNELYDSPPALGFEYTITGSGSRERTTSCQPIPGWSLLQQVPLLNGNGNTYSVVCLHGRLRSDGFFEEYTLGHAGADAGDTVNCAVSSRPSGYTLKARSCAITGSAGNCYSDICLWARPTTKRQVFALSHAGGNYTDDVDCRKSVPSTGLPLVNVSRIPIFSYNVNVYSDLCGNSWALP